MICFQTLAKKISFNQGEIEAKAMPSAAVGKFYNKKIFCTLN